MIVATVPPAWAHDFWIQPKTFATTPLTPVAISLLVGHGPARQNWGAALNRITVFKTIGPGGTVDEKPALHPGTGTAVANLTFTSAGTHMIVLETSVADSELPSIRFNAYAKDEGLTAAINARAAAQRSDKPGREIYSRRTKALLHVGTPSQLNASYVTTPVGLSLEVVPERDPYSLSVGEPLPVRVLFNGKPLPGALVKLTSLEFDLRPVAMHLTDAAGRVMFNVPHVGTWLVNTIWSVPVSGNPKADFETTFSSLTFGYTADRAVH